MAGIRYEIVAVGILILLIFNVRGQISFNKFIEDNEKLFFKLKESDYDFLVAARYGEKVDPNVLFKKRVQNALLIFVLMFLIYVAKSSYVNLVLMIAGPIFIFKNGYSSLKSYYKRHLHEIDLLLPYYLKSLEILIQHYTVPVAITKSVKDCPELFRDGLKELIASIDAGNSTIDPYMNFAKKYPVRDSMRMMRLLYRLGLGAQDRKEQQLITFAKTISTLQSKSRETKYKERLDKMEKKTLLMLVATGGGVMVILLLSVLQTFGT